MSAGRKVSSDNRDWNTPPKYVEAIERFFDRGIKLDPCSNEYSLVQANTKFQLPETDGLEVEWNYSTIYINPPYGKDWERNTSIKNWLVKCKESHIKYRSEILALIPVATNTQHWKNCVWKGASGICFLYDTRLKFYLKGQEVKKGAPMSCAMVYWGGDFGRFVNIFRDYGVIVKIQEF